jgi:hypothetical protein
LHYYLRNIMRDDSPKFHLRLEKKPYPDEMVVFEVLKQHSNIGWDFELFQQILHRQDGRSPVYWWEYCTNDQKLIIERNFRNIGIELNIEKLGNHPFLFPVGKLSNDRNNSFSRDLVSLHEDTLDDWALANSYNEVYRVTLYPSFDDTRTVRVCSDNVTSKEGNFGKKHYYESWVPSHKTWLYIQHTIYENGFWDDATWNTLPEGYGVLDGTTYLIEGYKDGQYKFLYDEGRAEDKAGYVAGEFTNLRPYKP